MTAVDTLQVEALFASHLQESEHPSTRQVWDVVLATVFRLGEDGCAAVVAQEFGDHPEAAAERMGWCRLAVAEAFALARA